jgi:hypothetical protein
MTIKYRWVRICRCGLNVYNVMTLVDVFHGRKLYIPRRYEATYMKNPQSYLSNTYLNSCRTSKLASFTLHLWPMLVSPYTCGLCYVVFQHSRGLTGTEPS